MLSKSFEAKALLWCCAAECRRVHPFGILSIAEAPTVQNKSRLREAINNFEHNKWLGSTVFLTQLLIVSFYLSQMRSIQLCQLVV